METKEKYELEVDVNASRSLLFQYIATPEGLAAWYGDEVHYKTPYYTFVWDGVEEKALLLRKKEDDLIRFHWESDEQADTFFEIKIKVNEMTQETSLVVTDFALLNEIEEAKNLWTKQISTLKLQIGG